MCPKPPLESYAEQICTSAKIISAYCAESGYPHPSFDPQAPSITLPSTAPQNVLLARQHMITTALKIQQLGVEPSEYLPHLAIHVSSSIRLIISCSPYTIIYRQSAVYFREHLDNRLIASLFFDHLLSTDGRHFQVTAF